MTNKTVTDILDRLVSPEPSGWLEKAQWRQDNKEWLDRSAKIAVKILSQLRDNKKMGKSPANQKELADLMGVTAQYINKVVKGNENLTLETISHLEDALQMPLLDDVSSAAIPIYFETPVSSVTRAKLPVKMFECEAAGVHALQTPNTTNTAPTDPNYVYAMVA